MGILNKAQCRCGFDSGFLAVGGGMRDFETSCMIPAACKNCGDFYLTNYLEKEKTFSCPRCGGGAILYLDILFQSDEISPESILECKIGHKESVRIQNATYFCPK